MVELLIFLAVGAVAGWIAGQIFSGGSAGLVMNMLIGVVGAVIAGHLLPSFGIQPLLLSQVVNATLGALILLFVLSLVKR